MASLTSLHVLGYHTADTMVDTRKSRIVRDSQKEQSLRATNLNVLAVAGYVPGVGIITALLRIYIISVESGQTQFQIAMGCRAGLEFFGLGILLLIPDIIVSVQRHCCKQSNPA